MSLIEDIKRFHIPNEHIRALIFLHQFLLPALVLAILDVQELSKVPAAQLFLGVASMLGIAILSKLVDVQT